MQAGSQTLQVHGFNAAGGVRSLSLNSLAKQVKKRGIRTVVLGFVQQAGTSANDQSLSTQRARNVAAYLRSRGMSGSYVVRGDGVAGSGDTDRRVNVTVRYNAGC